MIAALVALAVGLVGASGTAIVLALRQGQLTVELYEARVKQANAESASALTANELGEVRSRLGGLVDARDREIKSLEAQLLALDGMRRAAVDRVIDMLRSQGQQAADDADPVTPVTLPGHATSDR